MITEGNLENCEIDWYFVNNNHNGVFGTHCCYLLKFDVAIDVLLLQVAKFSAEDCSVLIELIEVVLLQHSSRYVILAFTFWESINNLCIPLLLEVWNLGSYLGIQIFCVLPKCGQTSCEFSSSYFYIVSWVQSKISIEQLKLVSSLPHLWIICGKN